ncbi:MAG: 23S rRNA (uracil(1939)-C(5))-methyltransferase RlmD [Synechococcus sp.]
MANVHSEPVPGLLITVTGDDLDLRGNGIARWQTWVVSVPFLLPGEVARVQLQQRKRSLWLARKTESLLPAQNFRKPPCILAKDCGGCTLQHLQDASQAEWKQQQLQKALARLGGLEVDVDALLSSDCEPLGYRNRALIPLHRNADGQLRMGYYRRGSHRIVNLNQCPVLDPRLDALLAPIKQDLQEAGWPADPDLHNGDGLRHLGLRLGVRTGEVLLTLVSSTQELPGAQALANQWCARWPQVRGVTLNLQPQRNNRVLGDDTQLLSGEGQIEERFADVSLMLSTTTFFQVNTLQAEAAVQRLCQWLMDRAGATTVIDAYCGIGTIALPLASQGHQVLGLELHKASVDQGRLNAARNYLDTVRFQAGDVKAMLAEALPSHQALVVDPPRKGLDAQVVDQILACPPALMAYLSCDPATLSRDLKRLCKPHGPYTIDGLHPVDFFPQTTHLECLSLLALHP